MKKFFLSVVFLGAILLQANGQTSMNLDSLFNWQDPNLVPSSAHFNTYNEIWGYAKDGNEYAIIGTTAGTHIFDVTVPSASSEVVFLDAALTGPDVVHRDYHDYDDYLYMVCDEGASTLQIADLRFLPDSAPIVYDSDALFPRSHNIFIDTASARMYVCGGTVQFAVYSLADPTNPTLLVNCPVDVPFWSSIGYVHDVYVRGDTAYLNAEWRGVFVVDFSDVNDITMLGSLDTYPQQGYNHSGWLMDDKPFYAFADETHGMDVKIVDVTDLTDMEVTDTIGSNLNTFSIPHNLIYHDDYLYISHYFDGLYVYDCTDPAHPQLAGYYDTSTETHMDNVYRGCWGVYPFLPSGNILASDMQTGLWVFGSTLLSTEETTQETKQFDVYPNPTSNAVFIPRELQGSVFELVNMMGEVVLRGTSGANISLTGLSTGVYSLRVLTDKTQYHSTVVKR
ncbi:MAG: choice-of-anchor B family protein [Flavobacteriales bacterium]|nr:choice-of-anchor B family protein [Flavobacteriales bacterium]MCB9190408.1 choice-of-anchor B family protein [Flavobacteriales bacterium]MCB9204657.1 choice-of-anchor B family protein [Flavobacteriales bacterium]